MTAGGERLSFQRLGAVAKTSYRQGSSPRVAAPDSPLASVHARLHTVCVLSASYPRTELRPTAHRTAAAPEYPEMPRARMSQGEFDNPPASHQVAGPGGFVHQALHGQPELEADGRRQGLKTGGDLRQRLVQAGQRCGREQRRAHHGRRHGEYGMATVIPGNDAPRSATRGRLLGCRQTAATQSGPARATTARTRSAARAARAPTRTRSPTAMCPMLATWAAFRMRRFCTQTATQRSSPCAATCALLKSEPPFSLGGPPARSGQEQTSNAILPTAAR
jgi:hypothetical protein